MDGLQAAPLPLDSMITWLSSSSSPSAFHPFLCLLLFLRVSSFPSSHRRSLLLLFASSALICLRAADLWKPLFSFASLNVYLLDVCLCCTLRKHLKILIISLLFLPLPPNFLFSLFIPLLFISLSATDGQLARRTAGQQVKNPFTFTLSSLLFLSDSVFLFGYVNRDKYCCDP